MRAFHSFWSRPNSIRNYDRIGFPDFELLTAILSALEWQTHNGPITMVTDSAGADFFRSIGLGDLWDEIDTSLDQMDLGIDPFLFWAAGKLYALKTMEAPCVMLDTDLIIWKNLDSLWDWGQDIIAAHPEDLNPFVYPGKEYFHLTDDYQFPEDWDFSLAAANTAFLYLRDGDFRDYYVDAAIDFFRHIRIDGLNPVTAMCFAAQRVLPMCAKVKGQRMGYLLDLSQALDQDLVTHTWGFKTVFNSNPAARDEFCMRCVRRIMTDFPERETLLTGCQQLKGYHDRYLKALQNE